MRRSHHFQSEADDFLFPAQIVEPRLPELVAAGSSAECSLPQTLQRGLLPMHT